MPIKFDIAKDISLIPLNSREKAQINADFLSRCVMCRELIDPETKTDEHIYPKWLQHQFNLWNKKLVLPNGIGMPYRMITVSCCKECNGGAMSAWENIIKKAVAEGYDAFIKLDEEIIVWWIYKLYYTKLVKELSLKKDIKDPKSENIFTEAFLAKYNTIYYYMSELLKGVKFDSPKPYELYIYRTYKCDWFDYIDDISDHVVYLVMNDIVLICALDNFEFLRVQYQKEIQKLEELDVVNPYQALELYCKIAYYKSHYKFNTEHSTRIDSSGVTISSRVIDLEQPKEFDGMELYMTMKELMLSRGYEGEFPEYKENTMFSFILGGKQ